PSNRGTNLEKSYADRTTAVNRLMARKLASLEQKLGITIIQFDMDRVVDAMLRNPRDFGLTNLTDPACPGCGIGIPDPDAADTIVSNPDEYLWWDFVHMTRIAHAVIGEAAAQEIAGALRR